jgi:2-amino-4-hydroxy-6-hydroxymethyldihydropteridine diphosphokinase
MISVLKHSSVYETSPFGIKNQSDYLNCAVEILTEMNLDELFAFVKDAESAIGRKKRIRWGPREIDIDILIFGDLKEEHNLVGVPHKGIRERDFVIVPLIELDEQLRLPGETILLKEYLNRIQENYILSRKKINLLN